MSKVEDQDDYPGDEVFDRIEELCEAGEERLGEGKLRPALRKFWKAFELLPNPKPQYPSGTWLLVSLGDVYWQMGNFEAGATQLERAKAFPEGFGNPYLHFRLAQCLLELEEEAKAFEEFSVAFEAEGAAIFEDEAPKYWAFFEAQQAAKS